MPGHMHEYLKEGRIDGTQTEGIEYQTNNVGSLTGSRALSVRDRRMMAHNDGGECLDIGEGELGTRR